MGREQRVEVRLHFPFDHVGPAHWIRLAFAISRGIFRRAVNHFSEFAVGTLAGPATQLELDKHRLFSLEWFDQHRVPRGNGRGSSVPRV